MNSAAGKRLREPACKGVSFTEDTYSPEYC